MIYSFAAQLSKGKQQEQRLDGFFREYFRIRKATRHQQRNGIDRIFRGIEHGQRLTVEYKADWRAGSSGNAWLELSNADRTGWMVKCQAQLLIYYLPNRAKVYVADTVLLRRLLPQWISEFERRQVHDRGTAATGLLVPLGEFRKACSLVFVIDDSIKH